MVLNAVRGSCKKVAEHIKDQTSIFVLGKGLALPIAWEGALKIKEISYAHAEGSHPLLSIDFSANLIAPY